MTSAPHLQDTSISSFLQALKDLPDLPDFTDNLEAQKNRTTFTSSQQKNPEVLYLLLMQPDFQGIIKKYWSSILTDEKYQITQKITEISQSTLPKPKIYKGWGFQFAEPTLITEGDCQYIKVKVTKVFEGSALADNVNIDNEILVKITNDQKIDLQNIGEVASLIRSANSISNKQNKQTTRIINADKKRVFALDSKNTYKSLELLPDQQIRNVYLEASTQKEQDGSKKTDQTAPKVHPAISWETSSDGVVDRSPSVTIKYHFPESELNAFTQALSNEQDRAKLLAIFTKIYSDQSKIPQDIKDHLESQSSINNETAKKIFITLRSTAGYGTDGSNCGHSGIDFAFFSEKLRHSFFALDQACRREEIYQDNTGNTFSLLASPNADLHHFKQTENGNYPLTPEIIFGSKDVPVVNELHKNNAYKLLVSSYVSALNSANVYMQDKSCNTELIQKLEQEQASESKTLILTKEELKQILQANYILQLAAAKKSEKTLVLMPPKLFLPQSGSDTNFQNENMVFSDDIKSALAAMESESKPEKVAINGDPTALRVIEAKTTSGTEKPKITIKSLANLKELAQEIGAALDSIIVSCNPASFPMSMESFAVSQGKNPDTQARSLEECLRGIAGLMCPNDTPVSIMYDGNIQGSTKFSPQNLPALSPGTAVYKASAGSVEQKKEIISI